jgi:hypothetical protein
LHIAGGLQNPGQRVSSSQMHLLQIGVSCLCFQRLESDEIYNTDDDISFIPPQMMTNLPFVQFFNKFTVGHFCVQYPNEMSEQILPYAQLKLMQQIHYEHFANIEGLTKTLRESILPSR